MPVIGYLSQGMPGNVEKHKGTQPEFQIGSLAQDIDKVGEGQSKSNKASGREISKLAYALFACQQFKEKPEG